MVVSVKKLPLIAVILPKGRNSIPDKYLSMYFEAVIHAGGLPFALPMTKNQEVLEFMLSEADGLLITGGMDFDSSRYGVNYPCIYDFDYDEHSFLTFNSAMKFKLPILGICRGEQLMNVALGGTLIPDVPNHLRTTHKITNLSGKVAEAIGDTEFTVNSFHHQVVDKVAPGFAVTARSMEGFVEAIEHQSLPYLVGVQWHPERQYDLHMNNLFRGFIAACKH